MSWRQETCEAKVKLNNHISTLKCVTFNILIKTILLKKFNRIQLRRSKLKKIHDVIESYDAISLDQDSCNHVTDAIGVVLVFFVG